MIDLYSTIMEMLSKLMICLLTICFVRYCDFSALPGASRHHWGTDIDVYDANAVSSDYVVQLSLKEVGSGGVFDSLHKWLDLLMEEG